MGAWGYGPFHSDGALDWITAELHRPIAGLIHRTLRDFLAKPVRKIDVEIVDPAKAKEFEAWKRKNGYSRRRGHVVRRRARRTPRSFKAWRKKWASFHVTVKKPGRGRGHDVAEAAAGLLDELTPYKRAYDRIAVLTRGAFTAMRRIRGVRKGVPGAKRRMDFDGVGAHARVQYEAEQLKLYSLAARVCREIARDEAHIGTWREPCAKRGALTELARRLEKKAANEPSEEVLALQRKLDRRSCRGRRRHRRIPRHSYRFSGSTKKAN